MEFCHGRAKGNSKGRARRQQGGKATEREGEDPLSPCCQAKEGRGPPLGRKRQGGPAYWQSYLPPYTGKPEQVEGTEESDSKVN